jgi:hypothetical protein
VLPPHIAECDAGVHDRDSLWIADRVHIMVDINDDTKIVRRRAEVTGVVRRRRWSDEEKGRIVAEAIAPGAVAAEVARRHISGIEQDGLFGRCSPIDLHFGGRRRLARSVPTMICPVNPPS